MRFQHLLSALAEPQLITPAAAGSVLSILRARLDSGEQPVREGQGICGDLIEFPGMSVDEETGVAIVPVSGLMGVRLTGMEKGSGAVDTADVMNELDFCEGCEDVGAVVMIFDTPGGMYQGTPELGAKINSMTKPVIALCLNAHSAGYWAACCADAIVMTPSSSAGSIGVYIGYYDVTEALAQQGIKAQLFASGPYKGMGFPGVPLTDVQKDLLNERVAGMSNEFQAHVRAMRGDVADETMRGQTFGAAKCLELNLADAIVDGLPQAMILATTLAGEKTI